MVNPRNIDTILIDACKVNNPFLVKVLIDFNANVYTTDEYNNTPLHYAVANGHTLLVEELLKKVDNLYVNAGNKNGDTAMSLAIQTEHYDIFELLVKFFRLHSTS